MPGYPYASGDIQNLQLFENPCYLYCLPIVVSSTYNQEVLENIKRGMAPHIHFTLPSDQNEAIGVIISYFR